MEFNDPRGIYLQIADRMRERILSAEWNDGERIPSVREMAVELGVNPNTVARSYQVLVERQLIVNHRGKGYFITDNAAERILTDMKEEFMKRELLKIARKMRMLSIEPDELYSKLNAHSRALQKVEGKQSK